MALAIFVQAELLSAWTFIGATTCEEVADDPAVRYKKMAVNPKTVFQEGDTVKCLIQLKDVWINHRFLTRIYKDGVLISRQLSSEKKVGAYGWAFSPQIIVMNSAKPGSYKIDSYLLTGTSVDSVFLATAEFSVQRVSPDYTVDVFALCEGVGPGTVLYALAPIHPKSVFSLDDSVHLLVQLKGVFVNHSYVITVWKKTSDGERHLLFSYTTSQKDVGLWGWSYSSHILKRDADILGAGDFAVEAKIITPTYEKVLGTADFTITQSPVAVPERENIKPFDAISYPNPFNPSTTINFNLPFPGMVTVEVFSATGQKVTTLLNESIQAGSHSLVWDATGMASGVYFYRFDK